uniref:Filamin-B-like n=1 Tax=Crassostrea virginica TaxID=6565 RepID=A0A8B8BVC7_CRAVI|nr:filamin-B-like [Crassostrea virginica]XP_022307312.1 filamin-B-like [Crassostrea virginica]XP_022307313.1 filamin-B-like [Crassostrea virginica]
MSCAECTSGEPIADWMCVKCNIVLHDKCIGRHKESRPGIPHSVIPKMVDLFQPPGGSSMESNADKVQVLGPGVESEGVVGEFASEFNVQTEGAGPGRLGVHIRGPKGAFNVKMEKHPEEKTTFVCSYQAEAPGDYVITVTWSDVDVPGSPFKVHLKSKT